MDTWGGEEYLVSRREGHMGGRGVLTKYSSPPMCPSLLLTKYSSPPHVSLSPTYQVLLSTPCVHLSYLPSTPLLPMCPSLLLTKYSSPPHVSLSPTFQVLLSSPCVHLSYFPS